jgi:gas vesicle protein
MADQNNNNKFIGGILIGTAIGAVVGLLTAPRKGRDTRKILRKTATAVPQMAEDISSSVKFQTDRLTHTVGDNWHDTLDRLSESIAAGILASQSVGAASRSEHRHLTPPHSIDPSTNSDL